MEKKGWKICAIIFIILFIISMIGTFTFYYWGNYAYEGYYFESCASRCLAYGYEEPIYDMDNLRCFCLGGTLDHLPEMAAIDEGMNIFDATGHTIEGKNLLTYN